MLREIVQHEISLRDDHIRLGQLLKLAGLVGSGSDVRPLLETGVVTVNGSVEHRRGRQIHPGDEISVGGTSVTVTGNAPTSPGRSPAGRLAHDQLSTEARAGQPLFELGDPGPMRDRLVTAVLRGTKTATSSLLAFYEIEGSTPPRPGDRSILVGSAGEHLGIVELSNVEVLPLGEVGDEVATAEGEGFRDAIEWRSAHEHYWTGFLDAVRVELHDPTWSIDDATPVVVEWFHLIEDSNATVERS